MTDTIKRFSLGTVIVTALVSFLISGVGGALLQRYLSRAKPVITVTSAGFEGPLDYVELPDNLLQLSEDDSWGDTLSKYEKFSTLRDRESSASETEARVSKGIALAEEWLKESEQGGAQLSASELLKHPLLIDEVMGSSLNGYIRRQELSTPPVTELEQFSALFPLFERNDAPLLATGRKSVAFPTSDFVDRAMDDKNHLVAESFSKGVRANLVHYTKLFLEKERKNVLAIQSLRVGLRELILEQARPTVSITVHNSGGTSVAFRPYFGMSVLAADNERTTDSYLMLVDNRGGPTPVQNLSPLERMLVEADTSSERKRVKVEPYLPSAGGLSYTTISPGASVALRLIATNQLGAKGRQYLTAYDSGLLNTRILALTVQGKSVWSGISVFGSNVNKASEEDLISRLK